MRTSYKLLFQEGTYFADIAPSLQSAYILTANPLGQTALASSSLLEHSNRSRKNKEDSLFIGLFHGIFCEHWLIFSTPM